MIVGTDPMKPGDVLVMGSSDGFPPMCPRVADHNGVPRGLHHVNENGFGDILFECGLCGYMAAWRKKTNTFEKPANYFGDWEQPEIAGVPETAPKRTIVKKPVVEADPPRAETVTAPSPKVEATGGAPSTTGGAPSPGDTSPAPDYVTLKDAAILLGISMPEMLRRWKNNEIKTVAIDGAVMVPVGSL